MSDLFIDFNDEKNTAVGTASVDDNFLSLGLKAREILPQLDWVFTHRKIEYLSTILALRNHKSVQVRRKVAQSISFIAKKENLQDLQTWQLQESDRETWLILESAIDKVNRGQQGENLTRDTRIYSVSEALSLVKRLVNESEYVVEGEVSESRIYNQMYNFVLKDKEETRLECRCFAGVVARAGFPLNEGISLRITGKFNISTKYSRLNFEVTKIQLSGEGELMRNLKMLEQKLRSEGLFDTQRKRDLKKLPKNILLMASSSSAAVTDFLKVLGERRKGVQIFHVPIKTQGVGAEGEILERLNVLNKINDEYKIDTVVITRGGGSKDDLMVFNSEKVVRALHSINRPVVAAIGHERDTTLAELVADLRASTPSNAAELVSLSTDQVLDQLSSFQNFGLNYFQNRSYEYQNVANQLYAIIFSLIQKDIHQSQIVAERASSFISSYISSFKSQNQISWEKSLSLIKSRLEQIKSETKQVRSLDYYIESRIENNKVQLENITKQITDTFQRNIDFIRNQIRGIHSVIIANDPNKILDKGYVFLHQKGELVESKAKLKKGPTTIHFKDGDTQVEIK